MVAFPQGFQVPRGQQVELSVKTSNPKFPVVKVPVMQMQRRPAAPGRPAPAAAPAPAPAAPAEHPTRAARGSLPAPVSKVSSATDQPDSLLRRPCPPGSR